MSKTLSGRIFKGSAAAAIAVAISFAAIGSSSAATRHRARVQSEPARTFYNYVPGYASGQSGLTAGEVGRRTDPVLVPPGGYGPPDPASCGGFHC